jgi:hypothetical protein
MFRHHYLENLPEVFSNYIISSVEMTKFTIIIQELHLNYTNLIKDQIMQSIPFPTKELISGTIWILLIKTLNLMIL